MSASYIPGEVARLSLIVTDVAGVAADPGGLRLKVKSPDGIVTTYVYGTDAVVVKDSVGHYHADIPLPDPGAWAWRWETDAPNQGAGEDAVVVARSRVI